MLYSLTCPKLHKWTGAQTPSQDQTVANCPVCGLPAISSTPIPSASNEPAFDQYQTLPSASLAPLAAPKVIPRTDTSDDSIAMDCDPSTTSNDLHAPVAPTAGKAMAGAVFSAPESRKPAPDRTEAIPLPAPTPDRTEVIALAAPPSSQPNSDATAPDIYQTVGPSPVLAPASAKDTNDATFLDPNTTVAPSQDGDPNANAMTVPSMPSSESSGGVEGYQIISVLGKGGMGIVYKARQIRLDRIVALKMILSGGYATARDQEHFEHEARAVAQFKHNNILQIYEVGFCDGQPYFALEFVEGGTLQEKLEKSPMTAKDAAALVETLARALQYAHDKHFLHRDIKPANVLLASDGTPKIADFGLAKRIDRTDAINANDGVVGTPTYMSPEQSMGAADIGPGTDIYALGATLYEMLVGRPPFRGATIYETLEQLQKLEPVPLRQLQPTVPADLQTICLKCLHKDPKQRYISANAMADDLRNFLENRPIQARPVPAWEKAWKWSRRNPAAAFLIGVSVVSLLGFALGGLIFALAERDRAETQTRLGQEIAVQRDKAIEQEVLAIKNGKEAVKQRDIAIKQEELAIKRGNEAVENFKQAQEAVAVLVKLAQKRMANEKGLESIGRELMENALTFYDTMLTQQPDDPLMRHEIARAQWMAGDLREKLGRYDDADLGYVRAIGLYEGLIKKNPARADEYRRDLAGVYLNRSTVLQVLRKDPEADDAFTQATILLNKIPPHLRGDRVTGWLIGAGCNNRAIYLQQRGDAAGAEAAYKQGLVVFAALTQKNPKDAILLAEFVKTKTNLAYLWTTADPLPFDKANALYQEAFEAIKPLVDAHREVPPYRKQLGEVHLNRGILYVKNRQADKAFTEFTEAAAEFKKLTAAYPGVIDYRYLEAIAYLNLGQLRREKQSPDERETEINDLKYASKMLEKLAAEESKNASQFRYDWARCLHALATSCDIRYRNFFKTPATKPGDPALRAFGKEVEETYGQTLAQWRLLKDPFSGEFKLATDWFTTYKQALNFHNFEKSRLSKAGSPEVEHHLVRRVALTRQLLEVKPGEPGLKLLVGETLLDLATAQVQLKKPEAAAQTVAEIAKTVPPQWEKYWLAARCLAQCIPIAEKTKDDPDGAKTAQLYGERALAMLRDAATAGWNGAEILRSDKFLDPLRMRPTLRPGYEKLLKELDKK